MPRVLLLDLERGWRGGQNQALLLLLGLRARGHKAELLCARNSALATRAKAENVVVHEVTGIDRRLSAARLVRRLLRQSDFDVLHANEAHALTAAWLAGAHRKMTVVASRRVAFALNGSPLARARYHAAERIIAVSNFVARSLLDSGMPASSVRVVYDGVDIPPPASSELRRQARARWGANGDAPLLGCVGYLLAEKGQESLLRAVPAIRARFGNCLLLLAGDGPRRALLERLARELRITEAVQFAGHVDDISEVYRALDVFVFPSLAEPLGSSLLAAMAWGLPVVAVAGGAVPEVIEPGSCGLLVPGPEPSDIAAAVIHILSDGQMAGRLGTEARRVISRRFTADQMVEGTLNVYGGVNAKPDCTAEISAADRQVKELRKQFTPLSVTRGASRETRKVSP
jgi:glycosyltransferase involved in cell wall biosynthesis